MHAGEPLLYFIAEEIISFINFELNKFNDNNNKHKSNDQLPLTNINKSNYIKKIDNKIPKIFSGKVFEDRKSVFQAHLAFITSKEEVLFYFNY